MFVLAFHAGVAEAHGGKQEDAVAERKGVLLEAFVAEVAFEIHAFNP